MTHMLNLSAFLCLFPTLRSSTPLVWSCLTRSARRLLRDQGCDLPIQLQQAPRQHGRAAGVVDEGPPQGRAGGRQVERTGECGFFPLLRPCCMVLVNVCLCQEGV